MFVTVDFTMNCSVQLLQGRVDVKMIRNVYEGDKMPMLLNNGGGEMLTHCNNPLMHLSLIYFHFYLKRQSSSLPVSNGDIKRVRRKDPWFGVGLPFLAHDLYNVTYSDGQKRTC